MKTLSNKAYKYKDYILNDISEATIEKPLKSRFMERKYRISGVIIRQAVHYLRTVDKKPICSDTNGYFIARSRSEADHCIKSMRSRMREINKVAVALESIFDKEEQGSLFG